MARIVRFPLRMSNGAEVRTLEELQGNFDLESVLGYFADGRLQIWLANRYHDAAAAAVGALSPDMPDLNERLCKILGVSYQGNSAVDLEEIQQRNERKRMIAGMTADKRVLEHMDAVALNQEELSDLVQAGLSVVYLCGAAFTLPFRRNVRYIGINQPLVRLERGRYLDEYAEAGIVLEGVQCESDAQRSCQGIRLFQDGNYQAAFPIVQKEAESENLRAMYIMAMYYDAGYGTVQVSRALCRKWCGNAKTYDNPLLLFGYAQWCTDDFNEQYEICDRIFPDLSRLAEQGDALAQNALGALYAFHFYDMENALKWYRAAAGQGDADAQYRLGALYEKEGKAGLAAECYQQAACQEHARAQYKLGLCCYIGTAAAKDDRKAAEWFRKAAAQGDMEAKRCLKELCFDGMCVQQEETVRKDTAALVQLGQKYYLEKNYRKAAECYRNAADAGDANAQHNLGCMYLKGFGVPQDDRMAAEWFTRAAEQGFAGAQYNLGNMFRSGKGVPQSDLNALEWFMKAALQGDVEAQQSLGAIYYYGKGVPRDDKKAAEWFRKAAAQGNAAAQCNLGYLFENGRGVPKNLGMALEWYQKAAKQGNAFAVRKLREYGKNG